MPFDPSKSFTVVSEPESTNTTEPTRGFDPSREFKVISEPKEQKASAGFNPEKEFKIVQGPSLMDFMRHEDDRVTQTSPVSNVGTPQAPEGNLSTPMPAEPAQSSDTMFDAIKEGVLRAEGGIKQEEQQITVGRFGKPGTVARGVSDVASGLLEWALNKPEEALASVTALAPAIAAKYAPEIVKQFSADLGAASAGDKEALGRAVATVGAIAGPAALGKGAKAYLDRKLVNAPSEFAPPKPETVAEYAQMPGEEGAKVRAGVVGEKAIVEPDAIAKAEMQPSPLPEVPVDAAAVLPGATTTFVETTVKPALEGAANPTTITLYRAKSPTENFNTVFNAESLKQFEHPEKPGEFWTSDPKYADYFRESYGKDATIETLEIPVSEAEKFRVSPNEFKIPKKEGVKNASEVSEATALHGDVLRDVEGGTLKEGLPVDEGQPGVRAQTQGRVQEEVKPSITKEASAFVDSVDAGSVPAFVSNNLKRIARENGIEVTDATTPNEIASALKAKRDLPSQPAAEGGAASAAPKTETPPATVEVGGGVPVENPSEFFVEFTKRTGGKDRLGPFPTENTARLVAERWRQGEKGYPDSVVVEERKQSLTTETPAGKVEPAGELDKYRGEVWTSSESGVYLGVGDTVVSVKDAPYVPDGTKGEIVDVGVGHGGNLYPVVKWENGKQFRYDPDSLRHLKKSSSEPITTKPLPAEELKVDPASPNEPPPEAPPTSTAEPDLVPTKTGIKNASVDVQRAERGLPPLERDAPKSDVDLWNAANKRMADEPGIGERLTRELTEQPRPMTDEEAIILTQRMAKLRNEMDAALWEAEKAGDAVAEARDARRRATTREGREIARLKEEEAQSRADHYSGEADKISDALTMVELATGRETAPGVGGAGTLMGRAFRARQFMMREDFTREGMEMRKRKANGMEPLNSRQRHEIGKLSEEVKRLTSELDASERKFAKERALKELAELKAKEAKAATTMSERVKAIVGKVGKTLDARADAARARMRGKVMSLSPADLKDIAEIAASNLYHIGEDVGRWSVKMVEEFGETIKPHLDALWKEALRIRDEVVKAEAAPRPTATRRERKTYPKTAADVQETIRKRLRTRIAAYEARIAAGDFSPWRKKPAEMDKETLKISFELEKVKQKFNEGLIEDKMRRRTRGEKIFWGGVEGLNAMRAVLTSADLSAVLRQGLFIGLGHPIRAAKSIGPMLKAFANERNAYKVMQDIEKRDNYPLYRSSKLYLAEQGASLSKMEEAYLSRWAGKIPLVGRMVKASERAYITYLNKLRADSFDAMKATLSKDGAITKDQAYLISNFINTATGRGTIAMADEAAAGLNAVFFAPRFVASRFQLLGLHPIYAGFASGKAPLMSGSAAKARALIATEYARTLAGAGVVYSLGLMAGADIELDPRSSDFGKMRFGNTRIDMMGGLAQITVLISRIKTGEKKTLRTGRIVPLREMDGKKMPYGAEDMDAVMWRFLRSKLAPAPGLAWDYLSGSDVVGKPVTAGSLLQKSVMPMSVNDILASMEEQGIERGTAMALLTIFGASVQNFNVYERR